MRHQRVFVIAGNGRLEKLQDDIGAAKALLRRTPAVRAGIYWKLLIGALDDGVLHAGRQRDAEILVQHDSGFPLRRPWSGCPSR